MTNNKHYILLLLVTLVATINAQVSASGSVSKEGKEGQVQAGGRVGIPEQTFSCVCLNGRTNPGCEVSINNYMERYNKCETCHRPYTLNSVTKKCEKPVEVGKVRCTCANGRTPAGAFCSEDEPTKCLMCNPGYTFESTTVRKNCIKKPSCNCENGAAYRYGCDADARTYCTSCEKGYFKEGKQCAKTETMMCECEHGHPMGEVCTATNMFRCKSCEKGYSLVAATQKCEKDTPCQCPSGTPDPHGCTGMLFPYKCESCDAGFIKEDKRFGQEVATKCASKCTCANGYPSSDGCKGDSAKELSNCQHCKHGYELDKETATCKKQCTGCSATCAKDSCESTSECSWNIANRNCQKNVQTCECKNGTPDEGGCSVMTRFASSKYKCQACNDGFELNRYKTGCEPVFNCRCTNGGASSDEKCTRYDPYKCSGCDSGFQLSSDNKKCTKNKACVCPNGVPSSDCTGKRSDSCSSCKSGYTLNNDRTGCQKTVSCLCRNGIPGVGCSSREMFKCASCKEGFKQSADGRMCVSACQCSGGYPSYMGCSAPNMNKCMSCRHGLTLSLDKTKCTSTQKTECICKQGTPDPNGCSPSARYKCTSCEKGLELNSAKTRCEQGCIATREYEPVCCNGVTYSNGGLAECARCPLFKTGSCEKQCDWADHTADTCAQASGCEYQEDGEDSKCTKKTYAKEQDTTKACRDEACDVLNDPPYSWPTYTTKMATANCGEITDEKVLKNYRRSCAVLADKRLGDTYKSIMGYGEATDQTKETEKETFMSLREKWTVANHEMATSCYECISDNTGCAAEDASDVTGAEATCVTAAMVKFKDAFGFSTLDERHKPSDHRLKYSLRHVGLTYASKESRERCSRLDYSERRQCYDTAREKALPASCRCPTKVATVEKVKEREEQDKQALGAKCDDDNAESCFENRKEAYIEQSNKKKCTTGTTADANTADNEDEEGCLSNAEVRRMLMDVAAEKAADAMALCSKEIDQTADKTTVVVPKRAACLVLAKEEYLEYNPQKVKMIRDTVMKSILSKVAMKKASEMLKSTKDDTGTSYAAKMALAKKETAMYTGRDVDDIGDLQFKAALKRRARNEAYKKYRTCLKLGDRKDRIHVKGCRDQYKEDRNARTGKAAPAPGSAVVSVAQQEAEDADMQDDVKKAEAQTKREEIAKALESIENEKENKAACVKSDDDCEKDNMDAKRKQMSKFYTKALDNTDVKRIERFAVMRAMGEIRKECHKNRTPKMECYAAMKAKRQSMTGKKVKDVELEQEKKVADERYIVSQFKTMVDDDEGNVMTKTQKQTKRLQILKSVKGDETLTVDDLEKAEADASKREIEDLLDDDDDAEDVLEEDESIDKSEDEIKQARQVKQERKLQLMKKRVKQIRGLTDADLQGNKGIAFDKYVKKMRRKAEARQAAEEMLAASKAKATPEEKESKYRDRLSKYGDDVNDGFVIAERKEEAEDALVDIVVNSDIDFLNATKREQGKRDKEAQVTEMVFAVRNREPEKWEVRQIIKQGASKRMRDAMIVRNSKYGQGSTRTAQEKVADDTMLQEECMKSTGQAECKVYEIKNDIREAAKSSEEILNILEADVDDDTRKDNFKREMKKSTNRDLNDEETDLMMKDVVDEHMLRKATTRSRGRRGSDGKARPPATPEEKEEEEAVQTEAFYKAKGRQPNSKAEVKKSINTAIQKRSFLMYKACVNDKEKKATECSASALDTYKSVNEKLDEDEMKSSIRKGMEKVSADLTKECKSDSTKDAVECLKELTSFLAESTGENDITEDKTKQILRAGARGKVATMIQECKSVGCKSKARSEYEKNVMDAVTLSDTEFEEVIEEAAAKDSYEMSKDCDPEQEDCAEVIRDNYDKAKGTSDSTMTEAIVAAEDAGTDDIAKKIQRCRKDAGASASHKEKYNKCVFLVPKSWDNRTRTQTSSAKAKAANSERVVRRGAMSLAMKAYRACHRSAKAIEDRPTKILKIKDCSNNFRAEFESVLPKREMTTQNDETRQKNKASDRRIFKQAKREARAKATKERLEAEIVVNKEMGLTKSKQEVLDMIDEASRDGAPSDDDDDATLSDTTDDTDEKKDTMKSIQLLRKCGMERVIAAAKACKKLGPLKCMVKSATTKKKGSSNVEEEEVEEEEPENEKKRTISLTMEAFKGNGKLLMGKEPTLEEEKNILKEAAMAEMKAAISTCSDLTTLPEEMDECTAEAEEVADLLEGMGSDARKQMKPKPKQSGSATCHVETGPSTGNCPVARCAQPAAGCSFVTRYVQSDSGTCCPKVCHTECATSETETELETMKEQLEKDTKDGRRRRAKLLVALDEAENCMSAKTDSVFNSDCKDASKASLKKTMGFEKEKAVTEDELNMARLDRAATEMEDKVEAVQPEKKEDGSNKTPVDKKQERKALDNVKAANRKVGIPDRENSIWVKRAAMLNSIRKTASFIKAKTEEDGVSPTDIEVEEKITKITNDNVDSADLTETVKKSMLKNARAMAKGGKAGSLKLKATKSVEYCVEITSDIIVAVTSADIVALIKTTVKNDRRFLQEDNKVINTDLTDKTNGPKVTKEGVRNVDTGRTE